MLIHARVLVLLRVLAVVLGFEFAGVGHAAADFVGSIAASAEEHEQCPPDGACDDCPPGCPSCHCANRISSVAVRRAQLPPSAEAPSHDAWLQLTERGASAGPALPSVYRPPRPQPVAV